LPRSAGSPEPSALAREARAKPLVGRHADRDSLSFHGRCSARVRLWRQGGLTLLGAALIPPVVRLALVSTAIRPLARRDLASLAMRAARAPRGCPEKGAADAGLAGLRRRDPLGAQARGGCAATVWWLSGAGLILSGQGGGGIAAAIALGQPGPVGWITGGRASGLRSPAP